MKTRSLFSIGSDFYILQDLAETLEVNEETGEIIPNDEVISQLFNDIQAELGDKLDNTQKVIKSLNADEKALNEEIERLKKRKTAVENKQETLKGLMLGALQASGQTKLKTLEHSFSTRKSQSVNVINEELVGREYKKMVLSVDKTLIKNAIKEGKVVVGAEMQDKISLSVR